MLEHETETPPVSEPDVTEASSPGPEVSTETATPTDVIEAKPALLDVVRDAVEPKEPAEAAEAPSASDAEKPETPEEDGDAAPAEEPDNFDGLPFGRHPRFQKVLKQLDSFKTKASELEARTEELKGPAAQYASIERFMQANEISNEEMVNLFKLGALTKSDPEKALEELQPLLTDLYSRTGRILPEDLRTEVEDGKITEARARELAQARAGRSESDRRAAAATERAEKVETTTAANRQQEAFQAALVDWESATRGKDPDFDAKQDRIADRCRSIIAEKGDPKTPDEMKAILKQAHKDVTEWIRTVAPPRAEVTPTRGGTSSTTTTAQPKSLLDAVSIAASQAR